MRLGTNSLGTSGRSSLPIEYLTAISHALTAESTLSFAVSTIRRRAFLDKRSGSETIHSQQWVSIRILTIWYRTRNLRGFRQNLWKYGLYRDHCPKRPLGASS